VDGKAAGFALWFYSFSTFRGRHGIYLEDLFVRPEHRGAGVGKALLVNLAQRCVQEGLGRLEWAVLDWNAPAIAFYRSMGARLLDDWTVCRLDGAALLALGGERTEIV
jgi:GNAT superfamily N-acetyltransferase